MTQVIDHLHAYALVWGAKSNALTENGLTFREVADADSCRVPVAATANVLHAGHTAFASTWTQSLRFWKDAYGLAVEIDVPANAAGRGICQMFNGRQEFGMSVNFKTVEHGVAAEDGEGLVLRVKNCWIDHVSIAHDPAYPATACWLASAPVATMSRHLRAANRRWQLGRLADGAALARAMRPKAEPIDIFAGINPAVLNWARRNMAEAEYLLSAARRA